ncbi:MAG: RpiB/LacA/LacB family sugar-phosphate isomerase [Alphaproteobacteria bacterium]
MFIAADHAGVDLKAIQEELVKLQFPGLLILGTEGSESVDYPDFAHALAKSCFGKSTGHINCGSGHRYEYGG